MDIKTKQSPESFGQSPVVHTFQNQAYSLDTLHPLQQYSSNAEQFYSAPGNYTEPQNDNKEYPPEEELWIEGGRLPESHRLAKVIQDEFDAFPPTIQDKIVLHTCVSCRSSFGYEFNEAGDLHLPLALPCGHV